MRFTLLCIALVLAACAQQDPYKRITPTPATEVNTGALVKCFDHRWPAQFKCVQTVTLDFGPFTRTFTALLIVQRPGKFRLQGMTEQGLKLFDLAHSAKGDHVISKGDEINDAMVKSISRDIMRVFLDPLPGKAESSNDGFFFYVEGNTPTLTTRAMLTGGSGKEHWIMLNKMGPSAERIAWVDRFEQFDSEGRLFCCGFYEWKTEAEDREKNQRGLFYPTIIVLRDSGKASKGPAYTLTLKITELTLRDTPWPDKTFSP